MKSDDKKRYKKLRIFIYIITIALISPLIIMGFQMINGLLQNKEDIEVISFKLASGLGYLAMALNLFYKRLGYKKGYISIDEASNNTTMDNVSFLKTNKVLLLVMLGLGVLNLFAYLLLNVI